MSKRKAESSPERQPLLSTAIANNGHSSVRRSRQDLVESLRKCEEKIAFHKTEQKRLELEKARLSEELRQEKQEPLHDRVAIMNAEMHECLKQKESQPKKGKEEINAQYQWLLEDRKRALLSDAQTGSAPLVEMRPDFWNQLSDEERQQKGYVLAGLRHGSYWGYGNECPFDSRYFDQRYPMLSEDRDVYLARVENKHIRVNRDSQEEAFIIPESFRDDQDIVLAVLKEASCECLQYVSPRLMASPEFVDKVIAVAADMDYCYLARDLLEKLLEYQGPRRVVSTHPQLAVLLVELEIDASRSDDEYDDTQPLEDEYLIALFDDVYNGEWPREVVLGWARNPSWHRKRPENHASFSEMDRELALVAMRHRPLSIVPPELWNDKSFVLQAIETCSRSSVMKSLSSSMKYDFDVLIAAMNSDPWHFQFCWSLYDVNEEKLMCIDFDDRLYCFGQHLREVILRCDNFDAFLEASNNLCGLGLDVDTTVALTEKISSYVGVPTPQELSRLRVALVKTKNMGY